MPEVILRTTYLNSDFHRLAHKGILDFLNLPNGWEKTFPKDYQSQNQSVVLKNECIDYYLLPGWRKLIETKCSLSL